MFGPMINSISSTTILSDSLKSWNKFTYIRIDYLKLISAYLDAKL